MNEGEKVMSTVVKFPAKRRPSKDRKCVGCFSLVAAGKGMEIKIPSMQLQGEHISVLCDECYAITPDWVWANER